MLKKITILLALLSVSILSLGQTRQEKIDSIISTMNLVEMHIDNFDFQIEYLKISAIGKDSIKVLELEKMLTDEEIRNRLYQTFNAILTEEEVNDLYDFINSSAYQKIYVTGEINIEFANQFKDINDLLLEIQENEDASREKLSSEIEPIAVDREDGFYLADNIDYEENNVKDVVLEAEPSILFSDIKEAKISYDNNDELEISIIFTKKGARKLFDLTSVNIGSVLAIVINKSIIIMPIIYSHIPSGKLSINGNFTEEEADEIVKGLKGE